MAAVACLAAAVPLANARGQAAADDELGYPVFTGNPQPVPPTPVPFTLDGTMRAMYDAEWRGGDFWMDRLLARRGADPSGDWLWTRGRAAFMKSHDPATIGFGGQLAYWESIDNRDAYVVRVGSGDWSEVVERRVQTPSHWRGEYRNGDLTLVATKFITHQNVAVTNVAITNTGTTSATIPVTAESPYTTMPDGRELTGVLPARNNLTTLFPRLSGDRMSVQSGKLARTVALRPGGTETVKIQLGLLTEEIPESRTEYRKYQAASPHTAFLTHVRAYNKWWADNLPYFDLPDDNLEKTLYYRWWLLRFNYLDADIPGNDYQFPTSVEGALGYNNAIDLTIGMFIDDLKYLRNPAYSYGPWVSAGEVASNGKFRDNPGDPENWSASHTQYIAESAWQAYQIHGGQRAIVENLAHYAAGDARGQLADFDSNDNGLLETDWNAWTGNDADAVSFDYFDRTNERAESAYVYSGALAAAEAYDLLDNDERATEMRALAGKVKSGILTYLWNDERKLIEHRDLQTGTLIPWKEINNYYPFSVGLMPNEPAYKEALRLWQDPAEYPIFPFFTANQTDKAEAAEQGHPGSNNFSIINSTVTFRFLTAALRSYPSPYITPEMYKQLLYWNAWAHYIDGDNNWPDQNEFWADWNPETRHIDYRSWIHHTQLGTTNWTVIEDVMGLRPRADDKLELWPIDIGWDHFAANDLRYHGRDLAIVWDKPGDGTRHYPGVPEGYSAFLDGKRLLTVDRLEHVIYDPGAGNLTAADDVRLTEPRTVDLFAKAGRDLGRNARNLALGATPSASHTGAGTSLAGAVDGFTIDAPHWGSAGSGNRQDWYALDLGKARRLDTARLHFFNNRRHNGYTEPATYTVQYRDGDQWRDVRRQAKAPTYPRSNLNEVRFEPVTAREIRVLVTHRQGYATGLKELQLFATGGAPPAVGNAAPYVVAMADPGARRPGQIQLRGVVEDDGAQNGALESEWRVVDGPGVGIFANPADPSTLARFSAGGRYVLELGATDGARTSESRVMVDVPPVTEPVNVAPFATPTASYTSPWEDVTAINDGIDPPQSNDAQNPRWGTWPQQGTQWAQLEWANPVKVDSADVYFFDDNGGVRLPGQWKVQYWNGEAFVDVAATTAYPIAEDAYNTVRFEPVTTTRLRVELVAANASVGLLEVKANAVRPERIAPVDVTTTVGQLPTLPATVTLGYADGDTLAAPVTWQPVTAEQVAEPGTFTLVGLVDGTTLLANATVTVVAGSTATTNGGAR